MSTENIVKETEADFEKAWEEFGETHSFTPTKFQRRYARFFFFAGAQAGIEATTKLYEEQIKEAHDQIEEVLAGA